MTSRQAWTDKLAGSSFLQPALFDAPEQPKRRRPGSISKPVLLEKQIKTMIVKALELHPLVARVAVIGTSAGSLLRPGGSKSPWRRWGEPGTPDLCGKLKDGRVFRIEVKTPARRNTVTEEQQERLLETVLAGGLAGVATSIEEAFAIVEGME